MPPRHRCRGRARAADLVGADPAAVHPVVERHERDTKAAGRLAAGQIIWCLGGGFGVELPQLVAQRFANHLRELVGGHAAQKDFLGHNDSNLVDDAKKGFPNPSPKTANGVTNQRQPMPTVPHEDTSSAVSGLWHSFAWVGHCRVIGSTRCKIGLLIIWFLPNNCFYHFIFLSNLCHCFSIYFPECSASACI